MPNVIQWKKPDGNVILSFLPDGSVDTAETIKARGEVPSDWVFFGTGVPASVKKEQIWDAIKAERDHRTESSGYKVGTKWFHSDQKSRSQQLGLVLMGANIPANLQWKTMDSSFVTMTATLAQQLLGAAAASDQAIFAAAESHKAAMEASADPTSYNFSTGWPKGYGE